MGPSYVRDPSDGVAPRDREPLSGSSPPRPSPPSTFRLIFFTDGLLERNPTSVDIEAMVADGAGMHPREAVQHLVQAIVHATGGALNDDATALCLDWHGGPMREPTTDSGANR